MAKFDRKFLEEIKGKLEVELIGVASVKNSNSKELKDRATALLPSANSVVVLGKEFFKEIVALLDSTKEVGEAEPGAYFGPHYDYLNGRLNKALYDLVGLFRKEGYRSFPLPGTGGPVDQRFLAALFSHKHAAQLAGLGTIGRHSLLITPQFGPRVMLACLLTEAPLETTSTEQKDYCLNCDACIRECPNQALQVPKPGEAYAMNKFACRTYRQAGLTCTVCMKVCDQVLG